MMTVANFDGGGSRLPPSLPLGYGLTPSLAVMLTNVNWSFYSQTWYSEYSNWLPQVDFCLQRSPRPSSWFKGTPLLRGERAERKRKRGGEGEG